MIGGTADAVGFPLLGVLSTINMTNGIISRLTAPISPRDVARAAAYTVPLLCCQ